MLMKLGMMLEVDETFTTIRLSRSSEVRVKVRRWPQSNFGTMFADSTQSLVVSVLVWPTSTHSAVSRKRRTKSQHTSVACPHHSSHSISPHRGVSSTSTLEAWGPRSPEGSRSPEKFCWPYVQICSFWNKTNISLNFHLTINKNFIWGQWRASLWPGEVDSLVPFYGTAN